MKHFKCAIDIYQRDTFFKAIRQKKDIIALWMNVMKLMQVNIPVSEDKQVGTIDLVVSKMSRLIFSSENKIFSVNFPFAVFRDEEGYKFRSLACDDIDSKISSEILYLIESMDVFSCLDISRFSDPIEESCMLDSAVWPLLRDLMLSEDGYVRYDHDPVRANGDFHPLHHVDIFYSNTSTFKVGLRNNLTASKFLDVVDLTTKCHFLIGT